MDALSLTNEALTVQMAMDIAAIAVGLVFGYAAVSKLADVPSLVTGIRGYEVIPSSMAPPAAVLLIMIESLIAVAHFGTIALQFVIPATLVLLAVFLATTVSLLRRGDKRPCLCFGANRDDSVDISSLVRILMLLATELSLYWYLFLGDDPVAATTEYAAATSIETVAVAALTLVLLGWCFAFPKFYRAWRVVRT
jgi:hypothetical protein